MRNPMGNWCGYVQVPPESLLAGMDKEDRVELPPGWRDKRITVDDVGVINVFCETFGEKQPGVPTGMLGRGARRHQLLQGRLVGF
jgi:hypothetical protein